VLFRSSPDEKSTAVAVLVEPDDSIACGGEGQCNLAVSRRSRAFRPVRSEQSHRDSRQDPLGTAVAKPASIRGQGRFLCANCLIRQGDFAMEMNSLRDLYVDQLKDLYNAETQLIKALPTMAKAASDEQLKDAFQTHLQETRGHVERLQQIFDKLGAKP